MFFLVEDVHIVELKVEFLVLILLPRALVQVALVLLGILMVLPRDEQFLRLAANTAIE